MFITMHASQKATIAHCLCALLLIKMLHQSVVMCYKNKQGIVFKGIALSILSGIHKLLYIAYV